MLYCMDGFMVEGNKGAKCEKNKNGVWKWNKEFGSCVECGDDCPVVEMPEFEKPEDEEDKPEDEEEKPEDENEEPADEAPTCKDLDEMIPEDSGLEIGCKVNAKEQFVCKLECPEGTNFMGKDGKIISTSCITLHKQDHQGPVVRAAIVYEPVFWYDNNSLR